jgi:hypothetical protein
MRSHSWVGVSESKFTWEECKGAPVQPIHAASCLKECVDHYRTKFTYDWMDAAGSLFAGGATNPLEVRDISRLGAGYK